MKKFKSISVNIKVNTNKEKTWDLLFHRFGEVNLFNPMIDGSHFTKGSSGEVGCERQCDLDSKTFIQERIVAVRDNNSFDIDIIQGGLPLMDKMKGTITVKSIDSGSSLVTAEVQFNTSPSFMGGLMKGMIAKSFFKVLVGLKYYLETGDVVTKQNISDIMKAYKLLEPSESFYSSILAA